MHGICFVFAISRQCDHRQNTFLACSGEHSPVAPEAPEACGDAPEDPSSLCCSCTSTGLRLPEQDRVRSGCKSLHNYMPNLHYGACRTLCPGEFQDVMLCLRDKLGNLKQNALSLSREPVPPLLAGGSWKCCAPQSCAVERNRWLNCSPAAADEKGCAHVSGSNDSAVTSDASGGVLLRRRAVLSRGTGGSIHLPLHLVPQLRLRLESLRSVSQLHDLLPHLSHLLLQALDHAHQGGVVGNPRRT